MVESAGFPHAAGTTHRRSVGTIVIAASSSFSFAARRHPGAIPSFDFYVATPLPVLPGPTYINQWESDVMGGAPLMQAAQATFERIEGDDATDYRVIVQNNWETRNPVTAIPITVEFALLEWKP
jgi:hypothetical protein